MLKNLSDEGYEIPEMKILLKDHKQWSPESGASIPQRPVVSGRAGFNTHLSEVLSQVLEPVALEMSGAEISSTEELLERVEAVNNNIVSGTNQRLNDCLKTLEEGGSAYVNDSLDNSLISLLEGLANKIQQLLFQDQVRAYNKGASVHKVEQFRQSGYAVGSDEENANNTENGQAQAVRLLDASV